MSTKNFLLVSVRVRGGGHRFRLWLPPIALYVLRDAIISFDGWLGLVPGKFGVRVRTGADALQELMYVVTQSEIDVKFDTESVENEAHVRVKTM